MSTHVMKKLPKYSRIEIKEAADIAGDLFRNQHLISRLSIEPAETIEFSIIEEEMEEIVSKKQLKLKTFKSIFEYELGPVLYKEFQIKCAPEIAQFETDFQRLKENLDKIIANTLENIEKSESEVIGFKSIISGTKSPIVRYKTGSIGEIVTIFLERRREVSKGKDAKKDIMTSFYTEAPTIWKRLKEMVTPEDAFAQKHPSLHMFGFSAMVYEATSGWRNNGIAGVLIAMFYPTEFLQEMFYIFVGINFIDFTARCLSKLLRNKFTSENLLNDIGVFIFRYLFVASASALHMLSEFGDYLPDTLEKYSIKFVVGGLIAAAFMSIYKQASSFLRLPKIPKVKDE